MIRELLGAAVIVIAAAGIGAAPTANADPMSDLIGMLPPGYAPDSCHGSDPNKQPAHVLVALNCNEVTGIVPGGHYQTYSDLGALNHQFDVDWDSRVGTDYFVPMACPGAPGREPLTISGASGWKGRVACGYIKSLDRIAIMWTNESELLWARVHGTNLIGLKDWFQSVILAR
jgi:hypothetical protein